jgi:hypothetical protein
MPKRKCGSKKDAKKAKALVDRIGDLSSITSDSSSSSSTTEDGIGGAASGETLEMIAKKAVKKARKKAYKKAMKEAKRKSQEDIYINICRCMA